MSTFEISETEKQAIERIAKRALIRLDDSFRVYTAVSCHGTVPDYECYGIAVCLAFGPDVAFIPFIYLRTDMTDSEFRLLVRRQIPCYSHGGAWKATEDEKATALSVLAKLEAM